MTPNLIALWTSAASVGVAAVFYAKVIAWSQDLYFKIFAEHPYLLSAGAPLIFVLATWLVRRFAPEAKGSGIPQVLEAIKLATDPTLNEQIWIHRLVSFRTATIKVLSSLTGILGGASIGREGPTVQIAASLFAWMGNQARRFYPQVDFQSFLTAGAAAGVAAAFNTPIAGVTFAIEEITEGSFKPFKQLVLLGVVIAGITAQAIAGDYLYFGHPSLQGSNFVPLLFTSVPLGILGGVLGGWFARALSSSHRLPLPQLWWLRSFIFGVICSLIGLWTQGKTSGSGYEVTRHALESLGSETPLWTFPICKFLTTLLSFWSGMAGGIFAPCLSIGAGLGFSFASLLHLSSAKACALIGMVAFFSSVVQAPLTGVVIVMEMTDQHSLILPFMAAAFLSQAIGKRLMPVPLYRHLARSSRSDHSERNDSGSH